MELQLFIVVVLILLGVIDLIVGVSNDAVNFTNSAVGSKVASFRFIMIVAGLGMLMGVVYSGGMMEIARKGVFNPAFFTLNEVLVIFLAAMVADVILLDFYNTYGLPTSTTVSILADLLGAAIGVTIYKLISNSLPLSELSNYINVQKVTSIFGSIILSIIFAFVFGVLAQFIARLIFSFNYIKRIKYFGAIWGSFATTFMIYFVFIKGLKYASFMTPELLDFIKGHLITILFSIFIALTIIFQILILTTKVNVLKFVILFGTFALAMSFASNDLVNFIGVPLAGLDAYLIAMKSPDPNTVLLADLMYSDIKPPIYFLLIAGLIMFITLFVSKKARTVTKTEISLGRQGEGFERFQSNALARGLVSISLTFVNFINKLLPEKVKAFISKQFDISQFQAEVDENGERSSFDIIRASVILAISSALISLGTSLKLPLSTTYITFITAMAAALPDKAWGRESAVYRVSGVLTVIGGWVVTAILATTFAMIISFIVISTGTFGVIVSIIILGLVIWKSTAIHKKRVQDEEKVEKAYVFQDQKLDSSYYKELLNQIANYVSQTYNLIALSLDRLVNNDAVKLRKIRAEARDVAREVNILAINIINMLKIPDERMNEFMNYSTKIMSNLQNLADRVQLLTEQNYYYIANSHTLISEEQAKEILSISDDLQKLANEIMEVIHNVEEYKEADVEAKIDNFKKKIDDLNKLQVERVKHSPKPIKRNLLYFTILSDMDLIADNTRSLYRALRRVFKRITKDSQKQQEGSK